MLTSLCINNILLIDKLEINFANGLCVLSGETGAGKSILLDCLMFALGGRANKSIIRQGADLGTVTVEFELSTYPIIQEALDSCGLNNGKHLIIRRTITNDGRSKVFINDVLTSINTLKNIGSMLIEICGQHQQRGLLEPSGHRRMLDEYGNLLPLLNEVQTSYQEWQKAKEALYKWQNEADQILREQLYLEHVYNELNNLNLQLNEEEELANQRITLMQKSKIIELLEDVSIEISKNDIQRILSSAIRLMSRSQFTNINLEPAINSLNEAIENISSAIVIIDEQYRSINNEDGSLEDVETRLFAIRAAMRKYNKSFDALLAYYQEVESQLQNIKNIPDTVKLERQVEITKATYLDKAKTLSTSRCNIAKELANAVANHLVDLKMERTIFEVAVEVLPEENWSSFGIDSVNFIASTNPGNPLAPINKIASGGELSRFMLAIKVALAKLKAVPVLIFDEIDTGIGGATADAVGQKLYELAKHVQIITITHQPQVAAKGNYHLKVSKHYHKNVTSVHLQVLDSKELRQEELARMLSGAHITEEARAAAQSLLGVS
jgi:DNA repair protein RecN (Recombination protein N)